MLLLTTSFICPIHYVLMLCFPFIIVVFYEKQRSIPFSSPFVYVYFCGPISDEAAARLHQSVAFCHPAPPISDAGWSEGGGGLQEEGVRVK